MHKFRGVGGYDLSADLYPKRPVSSRGLYCKIVDERNGYIAAGIGIHTTRNGIPPIAIHATLHDDTDANWKDKQPIVVGDWTVPVADRIPDDLLDDLRRDPKGSLRIKIRLHREGVLLGWDIERRPGFDPKKRDSYGEIAYVSPGWVKTGGDFKEARGVYWLEDGSGNLVRAPRPETLGGVMPPELARRGIVFNQHGFLREKGWYIHPKTGQRIETDF